MPSFDIVKKNEVEKTFKVAKIMGEFDVELKHSNEHFQGKIEIENKNWQIGIIVGASGTGKTTIAKELFPDKYISKFDYNKKSVLDNVGNHSVDDITKMFYAVGFGSVPSWLKPYHVLSNGEKMRVDLANALLNEQYIVFDEFTSVVDRNVAQTACIAINKALKRTGKQFIAVTCHYDVIEWLEPDWIFDTNKMTYWEGKKKDLKKNFMLENANETNGENLNVIII